MKSVNSKHLLTAKETFCKRLLKCVIIA